jgi:hypothetical protein
VNVRKTAKCSTEFWNNIKVVLHNKDFRENVEVGWLFDFIQCLSITKEETRVFGSGRLGKSCSQSLDPAEFVPATFLPKDGLQDPL